jgi:hypothetical protein
MLKMELKTEKTRLKSIKIEFSSLEFNGAYFIFIITMGLKLN